MKFVDKILYFKFLCSIQHIALFFFNFVVKEKLYYNMDF